MQLTKFVLCPDKSSARFIKRFIAEQSSLIHLQVGTWLELLNLAQSRFCLPDQSSDWVAMVKTAIEELEAEMTDDSLGYTWSASFKVAKDSVAQIVAEELAELLVSTPPISTDKIKPFKNPKNRYQKRLNDLLSLHAQMGEQLPPDLDIIKKIINADKTSAIGNLEIIYPESDFLFSAWQQALIDYFNDGRTNTDELLEQAFKELKVTRGQENTALHHLQTQLFSTEPKTIKYDSSIQFLAVRDPLEEVEIVAYMIQQALQKDDTLQQKDIAVILPEHDYYANFVDQVFAEAGIAVAGLAKKTGVCDLGRELIYLFLYSRQSTATPAMVQAALFNSNLMPCSKQYANKLAQACFNGENSVKQFVQDLDGTLKEIVELVLSKDKNDSAEQLLMDLETLIKLTHNKRMGDAYKTAVETVESIRPYITVTTPVDWPLLLKMVTPVHSTQKEVGTFSQEGVAVFSETEMAWRPVKRLFVLGFVEGVYPQQKDESAFFLTEEKQQLSEQLGLNWISVDQHNSLKREVFKQQLSMVSHSINFMLPIRAVNGNTQTASASLGYIASLYADIHAPDDLIKNLDIQAERITVKGLPKTKQINTVSARSLDIHDLKFNMDLLEYRKDKEGNTKPESPSSFEKLMVSPLAWLFSRTHIEAKEWEVQTLDVMTMGSLAHRVFELLFEKDKPISSHPLILKQVPILLEQAATEIAPFLNSPEWHIEKVLLQKETIEAAVVWAELLKNCEAQIVANEMELTGVIYGCAIRGFADCIFKLSNNDYIVVDFKKSTAQKRTPRMEKGFDLQASLYKEMMLKQDSDFKVEKQQISVMYYTLNDQEILMDKSYDQLPNAKVYQNIDSEALGLIKKRIDELKKGIIKLNTEGDDKVIEDETGITTYALKDSPLIGKFSHAKGENGCH